MERMKHTGDYELDRINMLEQECADLEEENKKLNEELGEKIDTIQVLIREKYEEKGEKLELFKENKKLNEKVRFLEECLDRKEKVNKILREELEKLKSTFVYDAKKVRDVC